MNSLLRHDKEDEEGDEDQEITLSTASLLGLFLGLVLICGVFFGFGYSVGRRSSASAAANVLDSAPASGHAGQASVQSSPSLSPPLSASTAQPEANDAASPDDSSLQSADDSSLPSPADSSWQPAAASTAPAPDVLPIVERPISEKPLPPPARVAATASSLNRAGQAMVQIAAVGRREDADVLASALRQRGYGVVVRSEPQDKLLHVQVGPFPSRAQANAMRQKLLSDGYNAIIKQ